MSESRKKGNALEHAVHCIEEVMLQKIPGLKDAEVIIERNKIIRKNGVSYEIDLWVEIHPGTPYRTVHIFECKNWKRRVGAPDVSRLVDKLRKLNAASATLVARSFTSDAEAEAKNEPPVTLRTFSSDFWSPLDSLLCTATTHALNDTKVTVYFRHPSAENPDNFEPQTECRVNGETTNLQAFLSPQIDRHFDTFRPSDGRHRLEGRHSGRTSFACEFTEKEFFVGNHEVAYLEVWIGYALFVRHAKIVTKFNVNGRGGFIRLECPKESSDLPEVAIEVVTKPMEAWKRKS